MSQADSGGQQTGFLPSTSLFLLQWVFLMKSDKFSLVMLSRNGGSSSTRGPEAVVMPREVLKSMGVEISCPLCLAGLLGSSKGWASRTRPRPSNRLPFYRPPDSLHSCYSVAVWVSAYACLFTSLQAPNSSLPTPTNPLQGGGNLRVRLESFPGDRQPGEGRHGLQEVAGTATTVVAT